MGACEDALLMASSIIAVKPPLSGLCCIVVRSEPVPDKGPSDGRTALTPDTLAVSKLITEGLFLRDRFGVEGFDSS